MKMCGNCKKQNTPNCKRPYYSSLTKADDMDCYESKKQTNFERIRNMTIEEMAAYHARNITCNRCEARVMCKERHTDKEFIKLNCVDRFKIWLESEVSDNGKIH